MKVDELDDDPFASLLADYEAELAAGFGGNSTARFAHLPDTQLAQRLAKAGRCLELLNQVWPGATAAKADEPLPERVGRFQIVRELGRGGFGIVYLAFDPSLRRQIALKVQRPEAMLSAELRHRFLQEAHAAASLNHPHIVAVYEVGEAGVLAWMAAEFCPGWSLAAAIAMRKASFLPRQAAGWIAALADAVGYAHSRGILHRDIKPSNVLLALPPRSKIEEDQQSAQFETPPDVNSQIEPDDLNSVLPKLTDFGLAKLLDDDSNETRTGAMIGTPGYMSPEQIEGRRGEIGPATDVYGLGLVLYELLTGQPAYSGGNHAETIQKVMLHDSPSPSKLCPRLPRDLEAITLRAIEKNPRRRYASALELSADLRRFLAGEPTLARPARAPERFWKWSRRHPVISLLLAMAVILPSLVLVLEHRRSVDLSAALAVASQQEHLATKNFQQAQDREAQLRVQLYGMRMREAWEAYQSGNISTARNMLELYRSPPESDVVGIEYRILWQMAHAEKRIIHAHDGDVYFVAFSPDGKWLASSGKDQVARIWSVESGEEQFALAGHQGDINCVAFSPDGKLLATAGDDHSTRLWDLAERKEIARLVGKGDDYVVGVGFTKDGKQVVSFDQQGYIYFWSVEKLALAKQFHPGNGRIEDIDYDENRGLLAVAVDRHIKLWNVATDELAGTVGTAADWIGLVRFMPNGSILTNGELAGELRIWFPPDYTTDIRRQMGHNAFQSITTHGPWFAIAGREQAIYVLSLVKGIPGGPIYLNGHANRVWGAAFSPDDKTLASAGADGTIRLWEIALPPGKLPGYQAGFSGTSERLSHLIAARGVWWVTNPSDSKQLVLGRFEGTDLKIVREIPCQTAAAQVAIADDAGLLAVEENKTIRIERLDSGQSVTSISHDGSQPAWLAIAPGGQVLALGDDLSNVYLWSLGSQPSLLTTSPMHGKKIVLSDDGKLFAITDANDSRQTEIWSVQPLRQLCAVRCDSGATGNAFGQPIVAFSRDDALVAVMEFDKTIHVLRSVDGQEVHRLRSAQDDQNKAGSRQLSFSPDGRTLISCFGADVTFWQLATGIEMGTLPAADCPFTSLTYEPGEKSLPTIVGLGNSGGHPATLTIVRLPDPTYVAPLETAAQPAH